MHSKKCLTFFLLVPECFRRKISSFPKAFFNCCMKQELLSPASNDERILTTTNNFLQNAGVKLSPPSKPESLIKINSPLRFHVSHGFFIAETSIFHSCVEQSRENRGLLYVSALTKVGCVFFITFLIVSYLYSTERREAESVVSLFLGHLKLGH